MVHQSTVHFVHFFQKCENKSGELQVAKYEFYNCMFCNKSDLEWFCTYMSSDDGDIVYSTALS